MNFEDTFEFENRGIDEEVEFLVEITRFLLIEFKRLFGIDTMLAEKCIIYNDKNANCPMLITNMNPLRIRLALESLEYHNQMIFQLSHELCHYAIRQRKYNKAFTLSWFEELVCEAMSLYFLKWCTNNWHLCRISKVKPNYYEYIASYLEGQLKLIGSTEFRESTSIDALRRYEQTLSTNRETHRNERNYLYQYILKEPTRSKCFCDYTRYLDRNGITIDFNKWLAVEKSQLLRIVASLQP